MSTKELMRNMIREHDDEIDELRVKVKELEGRLKGKYDDKFTDEQVIKSVRLKTGIKTFFNMEELKKILENDMRRYHMFDEFSNDMYDIIKKHQKKFEP